MANTNWADDFETENKVTSLTLHHTLNSTPDYTVKKKQLAGKQREPSQAAVLMWVNLRCEVGGGI